VNDYVLDAKLGEGSSSVVYLGVNTVTGENYAVKRLRLAELARSGDALAGLEREIRLMRMFRHPNILKLIEVLHLPAINEVYMVLEYADNGCLEGLIGCSHRLPFHSIMSIIKQIAQALKYLHDAGYVHQDIKPSNILLTKEGRAILADFGIGHSFVSSVMVVGSPAYQAPEALNDSYGDESEIEPEPGAGPQKEDVWALGITLYQMLFLELPFVGENLFEVVNAIKQQPLKIPEDVDPLLVNLLKGMINVDPSKRFSVEEILEHPLVANANPLASDLPIAPLPKQRSGEVQIFKAETCPETASFADIALAVRRRSSLREYGFATKMRAVEEIPRTSPKCGLEIQGSDGELQESGVYQLGRRIGDGEWVQFD
jgi:[calcium/calmodulin-dependent protein kinase] kinase